MKPAFLCLALITPLAALGQDEPVETIPVEPLQEEAPAEPPPAAEADGVIYLDDIEVTATKRVKSQRDIAGSVGAIRGAELEQMHAQGMSDYLKLIPGVAFADQGSDTSIPVIRGIATQLDFGFTAGTTGVYLDDMPFADLYGPQSFPDLNPFDLERVEVLKGPQGTLFGSGALAGAVRYIAQKPEHSVWQLKASETLSRAREGGGLDKVTAGAVNVPLFGDALAFRAVGVTRRNPGLYDYRAEDSNGDPLRDEADADKLRQTSWRGLASWNVTDAFRIGAFYFDQKSTLADDSLASNGETAEMTYMPFTSPSSHQFSGGNLLATYAFEWGELLSSTNRLFKHDRSLGHQEFLVELHRQNRIEWYNQLDSDVNGFTQELRLSSAPGAGDWDWLIGASYLRYEGSIFQYQPLPGPPGRRVSGPEDLSLSERASSYLFATIDSTGIEEALFGELTGRFGEHWEVTLGARGYRTNLSADTALSGAQVVALSQKLEERQHFDQEEDGVNPKVAIRFLLNRNFQAYALASKGFQFGGVQLNPPFLLFVQASDRAGLGFGPYDSSSLWNYELGFRTEWFDRRLRFDVGAFYLDWKDLQLTITVPVEPTDLTFGLIANVGAAHSQGIEAALEVAPFKGGKWVSGAAWMEAVTDEIFDEANADGGVQPGTRLPGSPRFMWSNVVSYEHTLPYFTSWTGALALTHSHTGESPDAIRPTGTVGGYTTYDARLTFARSGARFMPELSLGVNNFTDERGVTFHSQTASAVSRDLFGVFDMYHFVPPRTVILSLGFKY